VKIRNAKANNRKKEFEITTFNGSEFIFPYANAELKPTSENRIAELFVDKELANEAITYVLESGEEGTIHIEQILDYNEDPVYLANLLMYKLSLEAKRNMEDSALSTRHIARRLNTSVPQLYRLLDLQNTHKSMTQLIKLLHILNLDVDFVVKERY